MKKNISLILMCLISSFLIAQNGMPKWAFPGVDPASGSTSSKILDIDANSLSSLPQPGVSSKYDGYIGTIPTRAYTNQTDDDGNLLFFVVDEFIYDKDGYYITDLLEIATSQDAIPNPNQLHDCILGKDMSIIQVPGECDKYYLILFNENYSGGSIYQYGYYFMELDFTGPNRYYPNRMGRASDHNSRPNTNYPNAPDFPICRPIRQITKSLGSGATPSYLGGHTASFTKPNNGERFMYLAGGNNVERFKVTSSGFQNDNYDLEDYYNPPLVLGLDLFKGSGGNGFFVDSDIILLSNGDYKLAVALNPRAAGWEIPLNLNFTNGTRVLILTIDGQNGDFIDGEAIEFPFGTPYEETIKGLEFSENGRYIYAASPLSPYLFYVDLNTSVNSFSVYVAQSLSAVNSSLSTAAASGFKLGNIEKGKNGKLYFASASGLGSLSNSNNPASTWNASQSSFTLFKRVGSGKVEDEGYSIPKQLNNESYDHSTELTATSIVVSGGYCSGSLKTATYVSGAPDNLTGPVLWSNGTYGTSATYTAQAGTNTIYFDAENEFGCPSRVETTFEAGPILQLSVNASSTEYCPKTGAVTINYTANYYNPNIGVGYANWTKDGVHYSTANSIVANGPGIYCISVEDDYNNCTSEEVCIEIFDSNCGHLDPKFNFTQHNLTNTFTVDVQPLETDNCYNGVWVVYDITGGGSTAVFLDRNHVSGVFNYTFQVTKTYEILHRISSSCSNIVSHRRIANQTNRLKKIEGLDGEVIENVIFPNPTTENLIITDEFLFASYSIRNTIGQEVLRGTESMVELNGVKDGVYFITFFNEQNEFISTEKFIKQK